MRLSQPQWSDEAIVPNVNITIKGTYKVIVLVIISNSVTKQHLTKRITLNNNTSFIEEYLIFYIFATRIFEYYLYFMYILKIRI